MDATQIDGYVERYAPHVIGRMLAESATDTSDAEIERTLSPCVGAHLLIPAAYRMRELGSLVLSSENYAKSHTPRVRGFGFSS